MISIQKLKQVVTGHQFGQVAISYPNQLSSINQYIAVIKTISQAISYLAKSSQHYLKCVKKLPKLYQMRETSVQNDI